MRLRAALLFLAALAVTQARGADDSVVAAIVNGVNAPLNRYSWVVSLRADDGTGDWHFCMGVLVQESVVMTAASCVRDATTGKDLSAQYYLPLVRIGGYLRTTSNKASYQLRKVVKTVINPRFVTGYVDDNSNNDIALLLLDKPSTKTPIALPPFTPKPKLPLPKGSTLLTVGWGWTVANRPSEAQKLQQIRMTLLPLARCQLDWGVDVLTDRSVTPPKKYTIRTNFRTNNMLCTVETANPVRPNGGPCFGDGGSPFFLPGASAARDVVFGVNSFGPDRCGKDSYVMTDVAALRPWIDSTIDLLTRTEWTGRVWGDPNVLGFDGSRFQTTTAAGYTLTVMNSTGGPLSLVAVLGKHFNYPKLTVMRKVLFKWGAVVECGIWNDKTYVTVNGVTLLPGTTRKINGGLVRFRENKARWSQAVVIEQPGMSIRINRVWDKRRKSFLQWFDIWVFLTARPKWPLSGVLGSTFPQLMAASVSRKVDLVGGLALPPGSSSG